MGIIVCGFPGVGKIYLSKNNKEYKILDIDSSIFKWIQGKNKERTDIEIEEFPDNYIKYILDKREDGDIILISIQEEVREELKKLNIKYYVVYPDKSLKKEYLKRYKDRDDLPRFAIKNNNSFEKIIESIEKEDPKKLIKLNSGEYLENILDRIID